MPYRLSYSEATKRALRGLTGYYRAWARREIERLAGEPRPAHAKELDLEGKPGRFRIRMNRWRLIYRVDDDSHAVLILDIRLKTGPETYEDLE